MGNTYAVNAFKKSLRAVAVVLSVSTFLGPIAAKTAMADTQSNAAAKEDILSLIDPHYHEIIGHIPPQFDLITRDTVDELRVLGESMFQPPNLEGVTVTEEVIPTEDGTVKVLIYRPAEIDDVRPGILWIHGGGYILGTAESPISATFARDMKAVVVSVDYRLAPEHPFPAGVNDSTAALRWMSENADRLGVDPDRIVVAGESAGAGMAAGVVLRNRDENGPKVAFQFLIYPMLDNLHDTPSGSLDGYPLWDRQTSLNAWEMYLGGTPGLDASPYAAAARAKDLSGLPPTFITVGGAELFRDEDIDYAQRLMAAGVPTQLAVFPGVFHGGQSFVPDAPVSQAMIQTYTAALRAALYPAE